MAQADIDELKGLFIHLERLVENLDTDCEQKEDLSEAHFLLVYLQTYRYPSTPTTALKDISEVVMKKVFEHLPRDLSE